MTTIGDLLEEIFPDGEHAAQELVAEGLVTFIKPVQIGEHRAYMVCTEEGVELALFASRDAAFSSARMHNLTPSSVH